jgi:hypothetical protein
VALKLHQLSQRILNVSKRLEANANEIVKDAAKAFIVEVVNNAPVDTGQLVSSWKVGLNYHPRGVRTFEPGIKGSTAEFNRAAVLDDTYSIIDRRQTGQTITFVNHTPYLEYVNNGEYDRFVISALDRVKNRPKQRKII